MEGPLTIFSSRCKQTSIIISFCSVCRWSLECNPTLENKGSESCQPNLLEAWRQFVKGWDPEGPWSSLLQSGSAPTPRGRASRGPTSDGSEMGLGGGARLVDVGKGRRGGKAQAAGATISLSTPAGRPAGTGPAPGSRLQPTAAVHLHPGLRTPACLSHSLHLSLWCSSTPALLYFLLLPSPAPTREPSIHPSTPAGRVIRTGVPPAAAPASGAASGSAAAVPAQPADWREGGRDDLPALRSRAPPRMGVARSDPAPSA